MAKDALGKNTLHGLASAATDQLACQAIPRQAIPRQAIPRQAIPRQATRPQRSCTALLCISIFVVLLASSPLAAEAPNLVLIVDASGSMSGQIASENKLNLTRQAIAEVTASLPAGARIGVVAYGHRNVSDCQDVETVLAQGPLDRVRLQSAVDSIGPAVDINSEASTSSKGQADSVPITRSLEHALALVKLDGRPATVILVSGGIETCGGDPCSIVGTAHSAGMSFILHVIGLEIQNQNVAALECSAEAGGGRYFDARSANELTDALKEAFASRPKIPSSGLRVRAIADGALADVTIRVTDPTGGQRAIGRTLTDESTNPRFLPLEPGRYRATISPLALQGPRREEFEFTLEADQILDREFDFSSGELIIGATHNGALGDAVIRIKNSSGNQVAAGRIRATATSNPKSFILIPGSYSVNLSSVEIASKPEASFEIKVEPGKPVELSHEFKSGTLEVTIVRDQALSQASISIHPVDQRRVVAKRRANDKPRNNPVRFTLEPGDYDVKIRPLSGAERIERKITVTIKEAATTSDRVDLEDEAR